MRSAELADADALRKENTPLILDGLGCVSEKQFTAIKIYLSKGGIAWLAMPFGSHDEKGFLRKVPLSAELMKEKYKNLLIVDSAISSNPLQKLISTGSFKPVLKQLKGDLRWAARIRIYNDKPVIHFMNTALLAVPDPLIKDISGISLLKDIKSLIKDNDCMYEINTNKIDLPKLSVISPELGELQRPVGISKTKDGFSAIQVNLEGVKIYAVVQPLNS